MGQTRYGNDLVLSLEVTRDKRETDIAKCRSCRHVNLTESTWPTTWIPMSMRRVWKRWMRVNVGTIKIFALFTQLPWNTRRLSRNKRKYPLQSSSSDRTTEKERTWHRAFQHADCARSCALQARKCHLVWSIPSPNDSQRTGSRDETRVNNGAPRECDNVEADLFGISRLT